MFDTAGPRASVHKQGRVESLPSRTGEGMKHVFGPVPSRRLGRSLGIDPIPLKTCNWNCVYCQLGRTAPLTNERRHHFPHDEIVQQVKTALEAHQREGIDWVTFVGSGEPTLHIGLGWMIRQVKTFTSIPIAVVTNGALLDRPEVREELRAADAVLLTLDAGTETLYRTINRPHPHLTFASLIEGLTAFRQVYAGKLWVEVMLVKGLNDSEETLKDLATVLRGIAPDAIHLSLPIRPPAEPWVQPADEEALMRATALLGETASHIPPAEGDFDLSGCANLLEAVVAIITRHPMREEELLRSLRRWAPCRVTEALRELAASGRAQVVSRFGHQFWTSAGARYAEKPGSHSPPEGQAGQENKRRSQESQNQRRSPDKH
jgi:wyosine [tRNA(Phe)-imidazoG37] synthetase (radical SAM superfamily)